MTQIEAHIAELLETVSPRTQERIETQAALDEMSITSPELLVVRVETNSAITVIW